MKKVFADHEHLDLDDDTNARVQELYDLHESMKEKEAPAQLDLEDAINGKGEAA